MRSRLWIFVAAMSCAACSLSQSEESSDTEGTSPVMGKWFELPDRSHVWFFSTVRDQDLVIGEALRCWPKDLKFDCLRLTNHNIAYTATRFQIPTLSDIDDYLDDWRPRVAYSCNFDGVLEPPTEWIGSVEETLHTNITMPGNRFIPWSKEQVVNYLKRAGVEADSYVNCRNIALMIRKNQSSNRVLWEGNVNYRDIVE